MRFLDGFTQNLSGPACNSASYTARNLHLSIAKLDFPTDISGLEDQQRLNPEKDVLPVYNGNFGLK